MSIEGLQPQDEFYIADAASFIVIVRGEDYIFTCTSDNDNNKSTISFWLTRKELGELGEILVKVSGNI